MTGYRDGIAVGVDIGAEGALVAVRRCLRPGVDVGRVEGRFSRDVVYQTNAATYYTDGRVDVEKLSAVMYRLSQIAAGSPLVFGVERAEKRPGEGVVATASNFEAYGALRGFLAARGYRVALWRSQAWQARMKVEYATTAARASELVGARRKPTKARSIAAAERFAVGVNLYEGKGRRRRTKPGDGLADAACIALATSKLDLSDARLVEVST